MLLSGNWAWITKTGGGAIARAAAPGPLVADAVQLEAPATGVSQVWSVAVRAGDEDLEAGPRRGRTR